MNKITTWLPEFPGFYESELSYWIEQEIEHEIERLCDEDENLSWDDAYESLEDKFNYQLAQINVAKGYVEVWGETYEVPVEYSDIDSPREYNFTTDRLEIEVPEDFLVALGNRCLNGDLREFFDVKIKQWFTSRSGFISFYSNDIDDEEWQDLENYDANQWSAVLAAHVDSTGENMNLDDHRIYEAAQYGWVV